MLRYNDLINYVIGSLYKLKIKGLNSYYSLSTILKQLNYETSIEDMYQIGKYLAAEGFVKIERQIGDIFLKITTDGVLHVENKNIDVSFGIYLETSNLPFDLGKILDMSLPNIKRLREPILDKLRTAREKIEQTVNLKDIDVTKDLDILKLELDKNIPDREVLFIKINELKKYENLSSEIRDLAEAINEY